MYQICLITAAAKRALQGWSEFSYIPQRFEARVEFRFLPEKKLFGTRVHTAKNVPAWYEHCSRKRLQDIVMNIPISVDDLGSLGFSSPTEGSIVCFYEGARATSFSSRWEPDPAGIKWNAFYTEHEWAGNTAKKPHFVNNSDSFRSVLCQVREFAHLIDFDEFAVTFDNALSILSGSPSFKESIYDVPLPELPEYNLQILKAAITADVFGAMGSWNDSPPFVAREKGLHSQYESLSRELLKQVRLAYMYAMNEW